MIEINNKTRSRIDEIFLKKVIEKFLTRHRIEDQDISIAFVGDRTMRRLNRTCRGADRTTDVLAFPDKDKGFLGEIIIDYAQIKRQAPKYAGSAKAELTFILIHGLLHLSGYRDDTVKRKKRMDAMAANFIKKL